MSPTKFNYESPTTNRAKILNVSEFTGVVASMTAVPEQTVGEILRSWAMHLVVHGVLARRSTPNDLCRSCIQKHFQSVKDMPDPERFFKHELKHIDEWLPYPTDTTATVLSALMESLENSGVVPAAVGRSFRG